MGINFEKEFGNFNNTDIVISCISWVRCQCGKRKANTGRFRIFF